MPLVSAAEAWALCRVLPCASNNSAIAALRGTAGFCSLQYQPPSLWSWTQSQASDTGSKLCAPCLGHLNSRQSSTVDTPRPPPTQPHSSAAASPLLCALLASAPCASSPPTLPCHAPSAALLPHRPLLQILPNLSSRSMSLLCSHSSTTSASASPSRSYLPCTFPSTSCSPCLPGSWLLLPLPAASARRHYRIPDRVTRPKVPYSQRAGRPAPAPWPEFERLLTPTQVRTAAAAVASAPQPAASTKMHRSVVRFPQEVVVSLHEGTLSLTGKAGSVALDLGTLDPTGLCAYQLLQPLAPSLPDPSHKLNPPAPSEQASASTPAGVATPLAMTQPLLAVVSPHRGRFEELTKRIASAIRGVTQGFMVGLSVKGVGYKVEPLDDPALLQLAPINAKPGPGGAPPKPYYFEPGSVGTDKPVTIAYPHPKPTRGLRLKVGYSRPALYTFPEGVCGFIPKPTQMYVYGLDEAHVRRVAAEVRSIRKPNPYTGNGIQLLDEVIKLKQRSGTK